MSHTESSEGVDATGDLPFQTVSGDSTTRKERLYRTLDRSVLAPLRIMWGDWRGKIGISLVLLYVLMGTLGVYALRPPDTDTMNQLIQPFRMWKYPLGTDRSGQGLLRMTVHATPQMLKMVSAGGIFAVLVGSVVGMVAGYKGGWLDYALMIVTDTLMTLPGLPLIMVLAFLFQPQNAYVIGLLLAINAWTGLARSIRSQMLPLRDVEYVEANRLMGVPVPSILLRDIVPNLMPYILVSFVTASRGIIFDSVALYFLGILPTNKANWGVMMNTAYSSGGALYGLDAAHWLVIPMIAIVLLTLGLILLSQSADRLFNPRIRARHQKTTTDAEPESGGGEESASTTSVGP